MKPTKRHRIIIDRVRTRDTNVEELSAALGASEATVRRDLTLLAKQRLLVRTHGGATALIGVHEPEASLEERKGSHRDEKDAIAKAATTEGLEPIKQKSPYESIDPPHRNRPNYGLPAHRCSTRPRCLPYSERYADAGNHRAPHSAWQRHGDDVSQLLTIAVLDGCG